MLDLDELERLARAATVGPWVSFAEEPSRLYTVASVGGDRNTPIREICQEPGGDERIADMAYIAAANPATILALLARLRAAEAEAGRLREALEYYALTTVVSSWGMEELAPNWDIARAALGLPAPTPSEYREALGEVELFTCEHCGCATTMLVDGRCYDCLEARDGD